MQLAYDATVFMEDALTEITKTLTETILIVGLVVFLFMGSMRTALVPLVAMPVSLIGAAIVMYAARLQPQPADHPGHRAVGRARGRRRDRGGRERRAPRARGTNPDRRGAARRARAGGPDHRDDDHAGGGLHARSASRAASPARCSSSSPSRWPPRSWCPGIVAVTLSPVMSSRFVHEHGHEGRLTRLVNRALRRGAPQLRPAARRRARHALGRSSRPRCW